MKHEIDYEYGTATLYSPVEPSEAIRRFHELASQCFGIRKSIGETVLIGSEPSEKLPAPWNRFRSGNELLEHSGGDVIIWNVKGRKIKSEWD